MVRSPSAEVRLQAKLWGWKVWAHAIFQDPHKTITRASHDITFPTQPLTSTVGPSVHVQQPPRRRKAVEVSCTGWVASLGQDRPSPVGGVVDVQVVEGTWRE